MRDEAHGFLQFEVGDGKQIHLWTDWWHPDGILLEKFGSSVVYDAHSKMDAKLSSVIREGNWLWAPARFDALVEFQSKLSLIEIGEKDVPKCIISKTGRYSSSDTWEALRLKYMRVDWWDLIWFFLAIPRHAFILWLAMKNALTTGDKLLKWGFQGRTMCVFCRYGVEDRAHLFIGCSYTKRIWKDIMSLCDLQDPLVCWDEVVGEGIQHWKKKFLKALIRR